MKRIVIEADVARAAYAALLVQGRWYAARGYKIPKKIGDALAALSVGLGIPWRETVDTVFR